MSRLGRLVVVASREAVLVWLLLVATEHLRGALTRRLLERRVSSSLRSILGELAPVVSLGESPNRPVVVSGESPGGYPGDYPGDRLGEGL